jgi:hypothetical protein
LADIQAAISAVGCATAEVGPESRH